MHVSLDSALGRQRRLNQIGESIMQIAPDPAAAYSLRSLTGGDPRAARVRRNSNDEQDFTVSEVSSGALVDFVLNNTKSLLNSRAYFDGSSNYIAYSNGSDFSLSSNESFELSFNFVYVENSNLNRRILSVADSSGNNNIFEIYKQPSAASSAIGIMFGGDGTAKVNTGALTSGKEYLIKFGYDGSSFFCDLDGTTVQSSTETHSGISTAGNIIIGARHDTNQKASGVISNISFSKSGTTVFSVSGHGTTASNWTSDQSDSPTINGTLAAYTGQEMDGSVETWYDQSGNGRDAVQATASKQPLIVEGGSLNVDSFSNPTIRFEKDSETHFITTDETLDPNLEVSVFVVQKDEQVVNQNSGWVSMREGTSQGRKTAFEMGVNNNSIKFRLIYDPGADNTNKTQQEVTVASDGLGTTSIMTGIKTSSGDLDGFFNGSSVVDTTVADNTDLGSDYGITMGKHNNTGQFADGRLNEVIFYLSDQTASRSAIETNLANHYGITLL